MSVFSSATSASVTVPSFAVTTVASMRRRNLILFFISWVWGWVRGCSAPRAPAAARASSSSSAEEPPQTLGFNASLPLPTRAEGAEPFGLFGVVGGDTVGGAAETPFERASESTPSRSGDDAVPRGRERPVVTDPEPPPPRVWTQKTIPRRWTRGDGLGAGSFGSVYLGLNADTGELFAVKEVEVLANNLVLAC